MKRFVVATVVGVATVLAAAGPAQASIGIAPGTFTVEATNRDGTIDTSAGSHPYEYKTSFEVNQDVNHKAEGSVRTVVVDLPAGFVGNPTTVPRCPRQAFDGESANCPPDTQIGTLSSVLSPSGQTLEPAGALYNLVPTAGYAASFGYQGASFDVVENASLIHGGAGGYRVAVTANVPKESLLRVSQTVWGVPADKSHDAERECIGPEFGHTKPCPIEARPVPFLTLPTSCEPQLPTELALEFVQAPGEYFKEADPSPQLVACGALGFSPRITVQPETTAAATSTGLHVDLHVPQEETTEGLAEADLKNAVVTLPPGLVVNPSSANGLAGCSSAQIGLGSTAPAQCPPASRIGTVEVDTPLVGHPLPGSVYVAAQGDNPFGSLLAIYVVVEDTKELDPLHYTGVIVKLAGNVEPDPVSGQLTTRFEENPQFPFEDFKLDFFGGPRAVLVTPSSCGVKTTTSDMTPWSSPEGADVYPSSSFTIGSGCGPSGFAPSFAAGTTDNRAGAFSPLEVTFARNDGEQNLAGASVTLPPGVSGVLSGIPLCGEPQAAQGTCSEASLLGEAGTSVGAGPDPYWVGGGKVYLTGPYNGGPFGLSIVVPTTAGPYTLTGNAGYGKEVVRASIRINPVTAQVSTVSDPLPSIIQGIPLDIRTVNVTVNRPNFIFNPTSCDPMAATGTLTSTGGASANVSNRFQAAGCAGLAFKPSFKVSTSGKTSRKSGASLHVRLVYPNAPQGTQANIESVHVELPRALPSRVSTLNHACRESVFDANPAGCPSQARVGSARAVTPLLPVPLEGPAYFVSHGGQKFPELIVVLQGYGITVDLAGETFISKAGITSSTFRSVPDVPVGSFELTLPEGPFSALAANRDLCTADLSMPTAFHAQNGATVEQNTLIEVQGCPYSLRIVGRSVHQRTLTLKVSVPTAGRLVASGTGVSSASKSSKGRQTLTLNLGERSAGKLRTKIALRFTPKSATGRQRGKGAKNLQTSLTVTFK